MSKPKAGKAAVDEGRYTVVVKTVADIGTHTQKKFQAKDDDDTEDVPQYILEFELVETSKKDKIESLSKWMRNSTSKKSGLAKLIKACGLGDNPKNVDLDQLLGKGLEIVVEHTENGNPKVTEFIPLKKGAKFAKGFMPERSVFLDDTYDAEAFEAMPKFIQDAAIKSDEFTNVTAGKKAKKK